MTCGWLGADLVGGTDEGNVYRSTVMADHVRDLCHESLRKGEALELVNAALKMAAYLEEVYLWARQCDHIHHQEAKRLERGA